MLCSLPWRYSLGQALRTGSFQSCVREKSDAVEWFGGQICDSQPEWQTTPALNASYSLNVRFYAQFISCGSISRCRYAWDRWAGGGYLVAGGSREDHKCSLPRNLAKSCLCVNTILDITVTIYLEFGSYDTFTVLILSTNTMEFICLRSN